MNIEDITKEIRQEIERLSKVLQLLGGSTGSSKRPTTARKKRTMSAAGRKRIAAAQRARWAKVRAAKK